LTDDHTPRVTFSPETKVGANLAATSPTNSDSEFDGLRLIGGFTAGVTLNSDIVQHSAKCDTKQSWTLVHRKKTSLKDQAGQH
jgi:hypothetical protein